MRKRWYVLIALGLGACLVGAFLLGQGFKTTSEQQAAHVAQHVETNVERKAGQVNYRNSLSACKGRGNELRQDVLILARALAAAERPELFEPGAEVVENLTTAEFAKPDGSIECERAVTKP